MTMPAWAVSRSHRPSDSGSRSATEGRRSRRRAPSRPCSRARATPSTSWDRPGRRGGGFVRRRCRPQDCAGRRSRGAAVRRPARRCRGSGAAHLYHSRQRHPGCTPGRSPGSPQRRSAGTWGNSAATHLGRSVTGRVVDENHLGSEDPSSAGSSERRHARQQVAGSVGHDHDAQIHLDLIVDRLLVARSVQLRIAEGRSEVGSSLLATGEMVLLTWRSGPAPACPRRPQNLRFENVPPGCLGRPTEGRGPRGRPPPVPGHRRGL